MPDHKNLKSIIFTGSLIACSVIPPLSAAANTSNLFNYNTLGSGAHVREVLMRETSLKNNAFELKCGNDSKTKDTKKDKSSESKCGEGKCGEGKCGEKTATDSTKTNSSINETHNKTKDAKCGEGKCGN
jgi:uncharacterized low-complexity protein